MKFLIILSLCIAYFTVAEELPFDLRAEVQRLSLLRGKEYVARRDQFLAREVAMRSLLDSKQPVASLLERIINSALAYRSLHPEDAEIVDGYLRKGFLPQNWSTSEFDLLTGQSLTIVAYGIVLACVGVEAFPVLAEDVLFEIDVVPIATLRAMVKTRNSSVPEVLMFIVSDTKRSAVLRAAAAHILDIVVKGIGEDKLIIKPGKICFQNRRVPEALKLKLMPRQLPKLELSVEQKNEIFKLLTTCLEKSNPEQMRSVSANVLRQSKESVLPLGRVLKEDTSPWVRAWCAVSLKAIGGEEALKAIEAAKKAEKNAEVLLVLEGKAQPFPPWLGIPTDSILQESNDTPSKAP